MNECYSKSTIIFIVKKRKKILNPNCVTEIWLPTEYNPVTGKFLSYDPYKYAKNLPQCFAKDERTCDLKYPSYRLIGYYGFDDIMPCKLTPSHIKRCREFGFRDKNKIPGYYKCKGEDIYNEKCTFIRKVSYEENIAPGCYAMTINHRIACGPMGAFEPPSDKPKTKVVFNPKKYIKIKKSYRIGPGHYCPPLDDLRPCDGGDKTKIKYIIE